MDQRSYSISPSGGALAPRADRPAEQGRRPDRWPDDPRIVSVERRAGKAGYVDVRLAGHPELVTIKTTDLLSYPRFRARIFDATGHMYGPIPADEWECVLLRTLRDLGAAA
jgi:hypothetical protein